MADLPQSPAKPTVYLVSDLPLPDNLLDAMPKWARRFGQRATAIETVEAPLASDGDGYRALAEFLRDEYHAVGAMMVSNAASLFDHAGQSFDDVDGDAALLGEIGVVVRTPGTLSAHAPAREAARQAYAQVFGETGDEAEALIIGGTGPARALALALGHAGYQRVTLTTLDGKSMTDMRQRVAGLPEDRRPTLRHIESQIEHDRLVTLLPPGSLVVKASGPAAPDTPSPVGSAALFPQHGMVWDLDAAGSSSPFLDKAREQRRARGLQLADGALFHQYQWIGAAGTVFGAAPQPADYRRMHKQIG